MGSAKAVPPGPVPQGNARHNRQAARQISTRDIFELWNSPESPSARSHTLSRRAWRPNANVETTSKTPIATIHGRDSGRSFPCQTNNMPHATTAEMVAPMDPEKYSATHWIPKAVHKRGRSQACQLSPSRWNHHRNPVRPRKIRRWTWDSPKPSVRGRVIASRPPKALGLPKVPQTRPAVSLRMKSPRMD